jgi:hypothetical protein
VSGGVTTFRADRVWDRKYVLCVCVIRYLRVKVCQLALGQSGASHGLAKKKGLYFTTNQPTKTSGLSSDQRSRRHSVRGLLDRLCRRYPTNSSPGTTAPLLLYMANPRYWSTYSTLLYAYTVERTVPCMETPGPTTVLPRSTYKGRAHVL